MGIFGDSKQELFNRIKELEYKLEYEKTHSSEYELEIVNLKKQIKCEKEINDGFVLTHGEYVAGFDIDTGRYSFKVIYGDDGRIETTGKDWIIQSLGKEYGGILEYRNLSLKKGVKLKIRGNVKLLMQKQEPINIYEDMSIIEQQCMEIDDLKRKLKNSRKALDELKMSFNQINFKKEYIWKNGNYYGGETIDVGIYDLKVISGIGYVIEKGHYHRMGNIQYGLMELVGLKISNKTKIEVTDNLEVRAVKKA